MAKKRTQTRTHREWPKFVGLGALILIVYANSFAAAFVFDSVPIIQDDPRLRQLTLANLEKFFTLNPEEKGWRHNYALYAYRAEQWDDLNRQLPLLGEINYEFFGGKDQYDKMVRLAKEHAKK